MKKPMRNILAVAGSDVASRLLGFATNAYLARVLGTSAFGIMSVGFSVLSYVAAFSNPGLSIMGTRDIASGKDRIPNYISAVNSLRFVLAAALSALVAIVALLFIHPVSAATTTILFALSAAPLALCVDWYFQGKENLSVPSASRVIVALVYLMLIVVLVKQEADVVWTAVAFLVANIAATVWLTRLCLKEGVSLKFVWNMETWRKLLSTSFPLGVSFLLSQTIMNLPVLIVGAIVSLHDAGLFNAAMKLIFAAMIADRVFYAMFFPVISRQRATNEEQFKLTASLAVKLVLSVAIPIVVGCVVFAREIMTFVYGVGFAGAAISFQILLAYFLFSAMNTVMMCVMIGDNRERAYLRVLAISTTILVALCFALSFTLGLVGGSLALAIGECVLFLWLFVVEGKTVFDSLSKLMIPSLVAGISMLGILLLLPMLSFYFSLTIGLIAFTVVILLLKGITKAEIEFLRARFV